MNKGVGKRGYDRQEVALAYYSFLIDLASEAQGLTPKEVINSRHAGPSEDDQHKRIKKNQHYVMGRRQLFDKRLVISKRAIPGTADDRIWQENIKLRCPHSAVIIVEAGDRGGERNIRHVGLVKRK